MSSAAVDSRGPGNTILNALDAEGLGRLVSRSRRVRLDLGQVLMPTRGAVTEYLFFETAVASLMCYLHDGSAIGVSTVGREGMLGLWAYLGAPNLALNATCETSGEAIAIHERDFRAAVERSAPLEQALMHHLAMRVVDSGQSIACARLHPLDQRLARLVLTLAERSGRDLLRTTHDRLAILLGVHRPSLTVALGELRSAGVVGVGRSRIWITNRAALEGAACECYGVMHDEYLATEAEPRSQGVKDSSRIAMTYRSIS